MNNAGDPAAGNPGSAAQVPTAPQKQEDLYDSGASGASTGESGPLLLLRCSGSRSRGSADEEAGDVEPVAVTRLQSDLKMPAA